MNKLLLPVAIFVSVMLVGSVCEHYGMNPTLKVVLLCLVAAGVQIGVSRFQRAQRGKASS